ncbi:MAG: HD-GYP domain-containing protein [Spirochaetota bacterium]
MQKKGRLDDREYGVIKTHPVIGETIIEPLGLIEAERDIIRHHHERIDGKGYPDRLGGKEIPILSRIVSIADSFDAMTSTRSYRAAQDMQFVLTELSKNAGAQFDAELVDDAVALLEPSRSSGRFVDHPPDDRLDPGIDSDVAGARVGLEVRRHRYLQ